MANKEERRVGNSDIIEKLATVATKVDGINRRLDKINGSIDQINEKCPTYREKVDGLEEAMKERKPKISNIWVKVYGIAASISVFSIVIGALIGRYLLI